MKNLEQHLKKAVKHFWKTRVQQSKAQGSHSAKRDQGARTAVTGGKQMDGFANLVRDLLVSDGGIPEITIFHNKSVEIPGYFRPEKKWDLLIVTEGNILAIIEFKSQVGSFGNNYNNRTEECIGSATDIWAAYREGAFQESIRPWLGYLMFLEEAPKSTSPVKCREPHFPVFREFNNASYAKRYEILCHKLVRERLYDAACFMMSNSEKGKRGIYREPSNELSFQNFMASLLAKVFAYMKSRE